jgi:hypothetical protein
MTHIRSRRHINRSSKRRHTRKMFNRGKTHKFYTKTSRPRKSKPMIGGNTIYGRGYGATCKDPTYSIYNTNALKMFPYKP